MTLPTDRDSSNTVAEHVSDHNTLHARHNALPVDISGGVSSGDVLQFDGDDWVPTTAGGVFSALGAEIRKTSNDTIANATWTDVDWDAEEYDDNGFWEGVTNPERITFAKAGRYLVVANIHFASGAASDRVIRVLRNGNTSYELFEHSQVASTTTTNRLTMSGIDPDSSEWANFWAAFVRAISLEEE